ncbi:microtubule-associated protein futsch-like [Littorina saxatilis]|uniref:microtubule-associated protein futsch-like n=1 Tax=Littorina saxatilis TaxID=31220 RepID=UPI0038B5CAF7
MEFLFRILPRKLRQIYSEDVIKDSDMLQEFLAVRDSCFEVDCRKFLNHLNSSLGERRKVLSFPCKTITFGPIELQKPCDEGYNNFWLDLNAGSKRIIIFCENSQLSSQVSTGEDCWDTVSVWQDDVYKFTCEEEKGQVHAAVHIKPTAGCVPRAWDTSIAPVLAIVLDKRHNLEAALFQVFGKKKVSDAADPVQCFTDTASEQHLSQATDVGDLTEDEQGEEESVYQAKGSVEKKLSGAGCGRPQGREGVKVSTPASTITLGSICSSLGKNTRRANTVHTPQGQTAQCKKRVKTPVVTVEKPVARPPSANTRTVKPTFVPPAPKETKGRDKQAEKEAEEEGSQQNTVIPDSLPFVSQTDLKPKHQPPTSSRKTKAKPTDSGICITGEQKPHDSVPPKYTTAKSRAAEPTQSQRSRSTSRPGKSQEDSSQKPRRTLRSSQNKTTSSQLPSKDPVPVSQGKEKKASSNAKNFEQSQSAASQMKPSVRQTKSSADSKDPQDLGTVPSSFDEFKAPKGKKTLSGTTKLASSSSSNQNVSDTQSSRKRSSSRTDVSKNSSDYENMTRPRKDQEAKALPEDEKMEESGKDNEKTKALPENVLRESTNWLNIPRERVSSSGEQSSCQAVKRPNSSREENRTAAPHAGEKENQSSSAGENEHRRSSTKEKKSRRSSAAKKENRSSSDARLDAGPVANSPQLPQAHRSRKPALETSTTFLADFPSPEKMRNVRNDFETESKRQEKEISSERIMSSDRRKSTARGGKEIMPEHDTASGNKKHAARNGNHVPEVVETIRTTNTEAVREETGHAADKTEKQHSSDKTEKQERKRRKDREKSKNEEQSKSTKKEEFILKKSMADKNTTEAMQGKSYERKENVAGTNSEKCGQSSSGQQVSDLFSNTGNKRTSKDFTQTAQPQKPNTEQSSHSKTNGYNACEFAADELNKNQTPLESDDDDDDSINYKFVIEDEGVVEDYQGDDPDEGKAEAQNGIDNFQQQIPEAANGKAADTSEAMRSTMRSPIRKNLLQSGSDTLQTAAAVAEISTEFLGDEENDEDNVDFRFDLDTPREASQQLPAGSYKEKTSEKRLVAPTKNPTSTEVKNSFTDSSCQKEHRSAQKSQSKHGQGSHIKRWYSLQSESDFAEQSSDNLQKLQQSVKPAEKRLLQAKISHNVQLDANNVPPSKNLKPQKTVRPTEKSLMPAPPKHKKQPDEDLVPPLKNLRKREPKSYKELDESTIDLEVREDDRTPSRKQISSRSMISDQPFMFTQAEQRTSIQQKSFVKKTFVMSFSSTQERTRTNNFEADPYSFEVESESQESSDKARNIRTKPRSKDKSQQSAAKSAAKNTAQHTESSFRRETLATPRNHEKLATPTNTLFTWDVDDDDDDNDDNDADVEGSQEKELRPRTKQSGRTSLSGNESSLLPIKFITPDPTIVRSDDSQNQVSPRLFFSQRKKSKERKPNPAFSGTRNVSPDVQKKSKERHTKQSSKRNADVKKKPRGRKYRGSDEDSADHISDAETVLDKKSEVSWIAKHESHPPPDPKVKKTYKRKPGNPVSPGSSPSLAFSWHKPTEEQSQLDSVTSSPEPQPVTPRQRSKKMYSPLDITLGPTTPNYLSAAGTCSSNRVRTSAKSKTSLTSSLAKRTSLVGSAVSKQSFQSLFSRSLASSKSVEFDMGIEGEDSASDLELQQKQVPQKALTAGKIHSKTKTPPIAADASSQDSQVEEIQAAAESSPSPSSNALRITGGKIAPSKRSSKAGRKSSHKYSHKDEDDEEEEEEEEDNEDMEKMRDLKRKGLLSVFVAGPSSAIHPSKSTLKRTFGDCSGIESEEEDSDETLKRLCLQPRNLFPDTVNVLQESATETSARKRKSQPSTKPSPKRTSRTSTTFKTKSIQLMSADVSNEEEEEEEMVPVEMTAPSVSTDDMLSQLGTELGVEEPMVRMSAPHPVSGVTSLLKGFGFDLQKHIKERKHQVQEFAEGALKLASKRVNKIWTTGKDKREQVLHNFKEHVVTELEALEQDVGALSDIEKKAEATYLQQLKMLHDQRKKLQQRVESVKGVHEDFRAETGQTETSTHQVQKCLETQMKKDMDRLKTKMLLDMQQQQLRRVKESLQKHIL